MKRHAIIAAFGAAAMLLLMEPADLLAQCSVGCRNAGSCAGTGAEWCSTYCEDGEDGVECFCSESTCVGGEDDPPIFVKLPTLYQGPGLAVEIGTDRFAITDCAGNIAGVTFAHSHRREVERELRSVALTSPPRERRPKLTEEE